MLSPQTKQLLKDLLSAPFIYLVIIPFFLLDLTIEMYHRICFPLYGIPIIKRSNYVRIDRHKLQYLNWFQKINCVYCSYANGLAHYVTKIAGETERYFCPITHQKKKGFIEPTHHKDFVEYGNEKAYRKKYGG